MKGISRVILYWMRHSPLLGRRAGYKFASQRARNIYLSDTITILRPDREAEIKALDLFEKYSNLEVSYTDCISFVLMSMNRIDRVFSFDKHFEIAGFTIFPQLKYKNN